LLQESFFSNSTSKYYCCVLLEMLNADWSREKV